MKTTKKIFAAFLAVMMIALMIPFTASAAVADSYTVRFNSSYTVTTDEGTETKYRDGFTVSIYKVASLNTETGAYTPVTGWSTDVQTALNSKKDANGIDSAALLTALNKDYKNNSAVDTWTIGEGEGKTRTYDLTVYKNPTEGQLGFGVYFIAWTGYPANATVASFNNTVVSLPYYGTVGTTKDWTGIEQINLGTKVNTGEPTVTKEFDDRDDVFTETSDNKTKFITEFTGEDHNIGFKLTGSVTGTNEVPSTSYKITDTYTNGLTVNTDSVAVTLTGGAKDITLTKDTDYTVTPGSGQFTVELKSTVLNKGTDLDSDTADTQNFYSFTDVVVTYDGYLNSKAVDKKTVNDVYLNYSQRADKVENTVPGDEVHLYSFSLDVVKVDANNTSTKLGGATFQLSSEDGSYVVTQTTSSAEATLGVATFSGLKAGTYKLQETSAPTGYNINSTVYTIVISDTGAVTSNNKTVTQVEVGDTPLVTPKTGGVGTMMFTIGGAALIACAGVLFLIVRKKKSAK